ncbi:hypothetical protein WR25_00673 [Diploscapter pachys]|uniref:Uncharacterized protein n=1 Tax=Diploscapter pachys TaxID=2018661 RepID=A0A2A2JIW4_9BILA|nr:hypothetical protein WR25_00673 [Diploscapter pachys]
MTFWKTVWYLVLYVCPPDGTPSYFFPDKSYLEIFLIFWIPNGVWVVFPFVVMVVLWSQLARLPDTKHDENDNQYIVCNSNAI